MLMRPGRPANFVRDHHGKAINGLFKQKTKRNGRTGDRYFALVGAKRKYFGNSNHLTAAIFRYG
jgi:hypothetical protein